MGIVDKVEGKMITIHCCGCTKDIAARLTTGAEIYPHRPDLADLNFWKCDACGNYVGCHKGRDRTKPLGNIPTPELREARGYIHQILDPMWIHQPRRRDEIYAALSQKIGQPYHTAEIKTIDEAREIYVIVRDMARQEAAA